MWSQCFFYKLTILTSGIHHFGNLQVRLLLLAKSIGRLNSITDLPVMEPQWERVLEGLEPLPYSGLSTGSTLMPFTLTTK